MGQVGAWCKAVQGRVRWKGQGQQWAGHMKSGQAKSRVGEEDN